MGSWSQSSWGSAAEKKNILQHSSANQASYTGYADTKEASWMKNFIQSRQLVKNMANVTWYELTFAVCIKSNSNSLYFTLFFYLSLTGHHIHTEISSFMQVSYYGGPQLSRQKQNTSRQNQKPGFIQKKTLGICFLLIFYSNLPGVAFAFRRNRDIFISLMFEQITWWN